MSGTPTPSNKPSLSSMTGFGRQEGQYSWGKLVWELRSVNHRYLELHFRLPESVQALEPCLRKTLRSHLHRGKIESSLSFQYQQHQQTDFDINQALVHKLVDASKQIQTLLSNSAPISDPAPISATTLLRWPGVIQAPELDKTWLEQNALTLFDQALQQLIASRQQEGAQLKQLIQQRLTLIAEHLGNVRHRLPELLQAQREKILTRLQLLTTTPDPDRLEQELVYLAQKADLEEELDRLDAHVIDIRRRLEQAVDIGRRLDFLCQELHREANTLSSKSIGYSITQVAVDLKVLIAQIREQAQNIE